MSPVPCAPGTYSDTGKTKCKECNKGFKCPFNETRSPIKCLNGTYSNETKSTECKICPAGFSCPNADMAPVECEKGYYSLNGGSYCILCPHGYR